jgi:hypothetical protein
VREVLQKRVEEQTGTKGALTVGPQSNGEIFVLRGQEFTQIQGQNREECRKH